MNIAVCIKGISYYNNYNKFGRKNIINFEKSVKNLKKKLFLPLKKKGYKIDFFLKTYDSPKKNKLLKIYKPKDYEIIPFKHTDNTYKIQAEHLIDLFFMVKKYENKNNIKYSNVIILRFDLLFKKNINELNIDFDKLNISFRCEKNPYIDDCFQIIPTSFIKNYCFVLWKYCICKNIRTHDILPYMKIKPNFMIKGRYFVISNPIFKINRIFA